MSHTSSDEYRRFDLLNGETSPGASICACLRVGDHEGPPPLPELLISDAGRREAHGRLVWDPDHRRHGRGSRFFSVAAVRLDLKPDGECLFSVGTGDYVSLATSPFRWVEKVQVAAAAGTDAPGRALQWDWLELTFRSADGATETRPSSCLPKVVTGARARRSAQSKHGGTAPRQQFAEISTGTRDVVELSLRGQVTLRANEASTGASPLGPEDLLGRILVFTDAPARRGR